MMMMMMMSITATMRSHELSCTVIFANIMHCLNPVQVDPGHHFLLHRIPLHLGLLNQHRQGEEEVIPQTFPWMGYVDTSVIANAPPPKNVRRLISEYIDHKKVMCFLC